MSVQSKRTRALPRAAAAIAVSALCASVSGCEKKIGASDDGPLSFEVSLAAGDPGTAEAPLPFSHDPFSLSFDVAAIDRDGQPATWFSGPLHIRVAPNGALADGQPETIQMTDGVATGATVQVVDVHGAANIWMESVGTDDARGNYATGLSPDIHVANPTIRDVQEVEPSDTLPTWETSALAGDFVEIDLGGRTAVVTGVFNDGCYVTDTTDPGLSYASIFVYNHSRPEVEIGDVITFLSGTDDEYFGFTELSFPSWRAAGTADVPDPVVIDSTLLADDNALEQYESALVEVDDVLVCAIGTGYSTYGQWAVLVDPDSSCDDTTYAGQINIVSATGAPDFDPVDHVGETFASIRGNLRYHQAADPPWMIYVRQPEDIAAAGSK